MSRRSLWLDLVVRCLAGVGPACIIFSGCGPSNQSSSTTPSSPSPGQPSPAPPRLSQRFIAPVSGATLSVRDCTYENGGYRDFCTSQLRLTVDVEVQTEMVAAFVTAGFYADGELCGVARSKPTELRSGSSTTVQLTAISMSSGDLEYMCDLPVETKRVILQLWERDQPASPLAVHDFFHSFQFEAKPKPIPRAIVEGDYEVTLSAENCIDSGRPLLPTELRNRTFLMRVEQIGADVTTLLKAPRPPRWYDPTLWGNIGSDGNVALTNYYGNEQWRGLWEQVTPELKVQILVESMRIAISPEGLLTVGKFAGYFETLGRDKAVIESDCLSTNHSVRFVYSGQ